VRIRAGRWASLLAEARWRWLPAAAPESTYDLRATLRLHLLPGLSLSVEGRRTPVDDVATAGLLLFR
jgi:hypothetical protein